MLTNAAFDVAIKKRIQLKIIHDFVNLYTSYIYMASAQVFSLWNKTELIFQSV